MSIVLSPDVEEQIQELVRSGRFSSADECVAGCIALFKLTEEDQSRRLAEMQEHGKQVRRLLAEGAAALERGDFDDFNDAPLRELAERIKCEGRGRSRLSAASLRHTD